MLRLESRDAQTWRTISIPIHHVLEIALTEALVVSTNLAAHLLRNVWLLATFRLGKKIFADIVLGCLIATFAFTSISDKPVNTCLAL